VPRLARKTLPGGRVHINAVGVRRTPIYRVELDARAFLRYADVAFERFDVRCDAYCLMPDHFHFLLDGTRDALSRALHHVNFRYARWFNDRYELEGHVFGDRFYERVIRDDEHYFEVMRYVVLNPVKDGLCRHPREWRWSSYRAAAGIGPRAPFLSLDWQSEMSAASFRAHVEEGIGVALPDPF